MIDTAGLDDVGSLGELRKEKTIQVLNKTDLAIVLLDPEIGAADFELHLVRTIKNKKIPIILVWNKIDLKQDFEQRLFSDDVVKGLPVYQVSSINCVGFDELKNSIVKHAPSKIEDMAIVRGLVKKGDTVVLVIPIDDAMPKGRLILPEVQTLRSILDEDANAIVCKDYELENTLKKLKNDPDLVITDSQVYNSVKDVVPAHVRLTSFSMLFARYKGDFKELVDGVKAIDGLHPGDRVLIAEACTHHSQKDDIGRVKIPGLLNKKAGGALVFEYAVAADFKDDLSKYNIIIMCGSCMINSAQVMSRLEKAKEAGVAVTNYGVVFAKMNGILDRTGWLLNE